MQNLTKKVRGELKKVNPIKSNFSEKIAIILQEQWTK